MIRKLKAWVALALTVAMLFCAATTALGESEAIASDAEQADSPLADDPEPQATQVENREDDARGDDAAEAPEPPAETELENPSEPEPETPPEAPCADEGEAEKPDATDEYPGDHPDEYPGDHPDGHSDAPADEPEGPDPIEPAPEADAPEAPKDPSPEAPVPDAPCPDPEPAPERPQARPDPSTCPHSSAKVNVSTYEICRPYSDIEHQRVEITVSQDVCSLCGKVLGKHETETGRTSEPHAWGESKFVNEVLEPVSDSEHERVTYERCARECILCGYAQRETVSATARKREPHQFHEETQPFERVVNPAQAHHERVRGVTSFKYCACGCAVDSGETILSRAEEPHQWEEHSYRATNVEAPTETGHDLVEYEFSYWQCRACGFTSDYTATEISRRTVPHEDVEQESISYEVYDADAESGAILRTETYNRCTDCGHIIESSRVIEDD